MYALCTRIAKSRLLDHMEHGCVIIWRSTEIVLSGLVAVCELGKAFWHLLHLSCVN